MLPSGGEISPDTVEGSAFIAGGEGFFSTGATWATRMPTWLNIWQRSDKQATIDRYLKKKRQN